MSSDRLSLLLLNTPDNPELPKPLDSGVLASTLNPGGE